MKSFIEEITWRGMVQDMTPELDEQLQKEMTTAYVGIDPTADSLHIGHLVSVMMLKHFQLAGHKPIALVGGATGMIGDPSGKSKERNLLSEDTLRHNQNCLQKQLSRFLDFQTNDPNAAEMVNNYDWMKEYTFLGFIRDIGKHITVNYMMAKDSVKVRMDKDSKEGLSFTEFSYQLVQGYDFLYLYDNKNCKLQMGGSDQWGNITTGIELIRRKAGRQAFALTCPLITKADGGKFGKTEEGNVWLDPKRTSPYRFYQFWLNTSDEDAVRYIKIFTLLTKDVIEKLIAEHQDAPHRRLLQKTLAKEVTTMVHSDEAYNTAIEASQILFGKGTIDTLKKMDEDTFLSVFAGVPRSELAADALKNEITVLELLTEKTAVFGSKGELRRLVKGGGLSINTQKIENPEQKITSDILINNKYIWIKKGKKKNVLIQVA